MKNNNIFISVLVTIIIILVICIVALIFVNMGKNKQTIASSSQVSQESSESSEPEPSSSEPEESSSETPSKSPEKIDITDSGIYDEDENCLDVLVKTGDVTFANKNVDGNITIDAKGETAEINLEYLNVSGDIIVNNFEGNLNLNDVSITGNIIVNSFGGKELSLNNTLANELRLISVSHEYFPIISVSDRTQLNKALIYRGAILRQKDLAPSTTGFTHIGIGGYKPRLWHDITLENVTNCYLTVNYPSNICLSGNTNIHEAYAYKQSHFYGNGSVQYLFIKGNNVSYDKITGFVSNPEKFSVQKGGEMVNRQTLGIAQAKPDKPENSSKPQQKPDDIIDKPDLPKE